MITTETSARWDCFVIFMVWLSKAFRPEDSDDGLNAGCGFGRSWGRWVRGAVGQTGTGHALAQTALFQEIAFQPAKLLVQ